MLTPSTNTNSNTGSVGFFSHRKGDRLHSEIVRDEVRDEVNSRLELGIHSVSLSRRLQRAQLLNSIAASSAQISYEGKDGSLNWLHGLKRDFLNWAQLKWNVFWGLTNPSSGQEWGKRPEVLTMRIEHDIFEQ